MRLANPFPELAIGELFETLLPDFVLAFAFFTALAYAVLGKRFDRQRPAVVMSAVFGLSFAVGLVWWERQNDFSIRDLGPLAVGFAIIILASVMYQAIRQTGGSWAGMGIALGASLLVSRLLGIDWPLDAEIIQTVTGVALVVGVMAFLMHHKGHMPSLSGRLKAPVPARRDVKELHEDKRVMEMLGQRFKGLRKEARRLDQRPQLAGDVVVQLKRMLPAQGWLTERMAGLRQKALQVRNGHVARLDETRHAFEKLPASAKKQASAELAARYNQLIGIDTRLERLDNAVAANESKIAQLTQEAQRCTERHEHRKLAELLKAGQKLQKHNTRLFKIIDHTEAQLTAVAKAVAKETNEVNRE